MDRVNIDKILLESTASGRNVVLSADVSNMKENNLQNQQVFDTFEQCLHITNELESAIAYYYKDEDDTKRFNFEEIFNIDDVDIDIPSPTKSYEGDDKDLTWDSYLELKPEIERETEEFIHDVLCITDCNHSSKSMPIHHQPNQTIKPKTRFTHRRRSWSNSLGYVRSGTNSLKDVEPLSKSLRDIKTLDFGLVNRSQSFTNVALF